MSFLKNVCVFIRFTTYWVYDIYFYNFYLFQTSSSSTLPYRTSTTPFSTMTSSVSSSTLVIDRFLKIFIMLHDQWFKKKCFFIRLTTYWVYDIYFYNFYVFLGIFYSSFQNFFYDFLNFFIISIFNHGNS